MARLGSPTSDTDHGLHLEHDHISDLVAPWRSYATNSFQSVWWARLVFEGGEELEKFELFEASLGAARDDLWDPQGGHDVEAQRPHQ
jgi:hypothetical protein